MSATTITSNGSKWHGEAPDSIDKLLEVLKENTLDPRFSEYGNFIMAEGQTVRFFGNFLNLSHVFNIRTDDPVVIAKLTRAIRENLRRDNYRSALAARAVGGVEVRERGIQVTGKTEGHRQ